MLTATPVATGNPVGEGKPRLFPTLQKVLLNSTGGGGHNAHYPVTLSKQVYKRRKTNEEMLFRHSNE